MHRTAVQPEAICARSAARQVFGCGIGNLVGLQQNRLDLQIGMRCYRLEDTPVAALVHGAAADRAEKQADPAVAAVEKMLHGHPAPLRHRRSCR